MWLPRYSDGTWRSLGIALAATLAVAGCATGGGPGPEAGAAAGDGAERVIPVEAQTLFEQAAAAMAAGDYVDAELRFKEFVLQYPEYPGAWVNLAIIHASNGDLEAADQAVTSALGIDPEYAPALNQKGMLLRRNGDFLEAEAAYMKAVTVSPDYALAHYNLGVLNELYLQRLEAALTHFERYQEIVGNDEQVERWIADLTRRVAASQQTANVTE